MSGGASWPVELLLVDEAERLRSAALEMLPNRHSREQLAMVHIATSGIDQRFRPYPKVSGRLGL